MELLGGQNFFLHSQMSESFDLPAGCIWYIIVLQVFKNEFIKFTEFDEF